MENASKALLIAASVLIVILLIAFGMRIFNSTNQPTDEVESTMYTTAVSTFNGKFDGYLGTGIRGSKVKSLANVIIANNAQNTNHQVTLNGASDATAIQSTVSAIVSNQQYTVTAASYDAEGYLIAITVG